MKNTHRVKAAADQAVRQRNYRRARERALTRLANTYPEIYRTYLEEEMRADEKMGKKWLDIDGNTSLTNTRA
jgi:predicted AAA+ superfamily ATPase